MNKLEFTVKGSFFGLKEPVKYGIGINVDQFANDEDDGRFILHFGAALKALYKHMLEKLGHKSIEAASFVAQDLTDPTD